MSAHKNDSKRIKKFTKLLYKEAELLAFNDLATWMDMYSDDGIYWMPISEDQPDGVNHVSIFHDDKVLMDIRRRHMEHSQAASKQFKLRASHIIGNVQLKKSKSKQCEVSSIFHCVVFYQGGQTIYAGRNTHTLVKQNGKWLIKMRRVDLINCDASHRSIQSYI